jgi:hypothetical protein
MNPNDFSQMRFTVRRVSWWQIALVIAGALAIGTALALVAASVFLVVAPVVLLSGLAYKLFGGRKPVRSRPGVTVIDAEYRVLSPEEIRHDGGPSRRVR